MATERVIWFRFHVDASDFTILSLPLNLILVVGHGHRTHKEQGAQTWRLLATCIKLSESLQSLQYKHIGLLVPRVFR